ncbi:cysteine--tRNA ligase, partial [Candidatus Obscuribacterales bacterium]|nr:cysteine--tRNA ligase [Candidatus Obscuribacterales bacterium]
PKPTEFIELMIQFTKELIEKGHAYESAGDVYFDVASFKEYGKLGKKSLEDLLVGARDQVRSQEDLADKKKSPADFALWKSAKEGELAWSSPWGQGRPGWHLECSTMTKHVLGETFDIHAGGEDLVFPHHENEIAQSEALHGKPMSKYWLHNSFVQVNSEKMSKSEGNFSTIQELLAKFSPDTIRLFALQTHYRNPIEFSIEALTASRTALGRILRAAAFAVNSQNGKSFETTGQALLEQTKNQISKATAESLDPVKDETTKQFRAAFIEAMDNDFNTAVAISQLFALADKVFVEKDEAKRQGYATVLVQFARLLGLTLVDTRKQIDSHTVEQIVNLVVELRQNARSNKDYATSDLIRQRLTDAGVSLMDTAGQTTWEKA